MHPILEKLKQRKLGQWGLAYLAGAWLVWQVMDVLGDRWGLTQGLGRALDLILILGFLVTLVLAWYHGEKGRQRVSGPEFVILTSLVLLAGVALAVFDPLEVADPGITVASVDLGPNSIVVLPFLNNSSDPEQDFLATGIAEELLNLLTAIPELEVMSRTTAFSFKGRDDITIPQIAAQLGVVHVLEGSVQRAGNMIRITAQLIDARTDTHLFSESYDRVIEDIFAIQDEIAAKVVAGLRLTILGELPTLRETDPDAYALFLQASQILHGFEEEDLETAIEMLEQVLEIDPEYAPAYGRLAMAYCSQAQFRFRPFEEGIAMGIEAAERAISLDPEYGYAHTALGWCMAIQGDVTAFAAHIERALELDPTNPLVLMNASFVLGSLGRPDEHVAVLEYLTARDPAYPLMLANLAGGYFDAGRWEEAAATNRTVLRLDPSFPLHGNLANALLEMGEHEAALAQVELMTDPAWRLQVVAMANYSLGRLPESQAALQELREGWEEGEVDPGYILRAYVFMEDMEAAFEWLERVSPDAQYGFDSYYDVLHDDPRWTAWLDRADPSMEELAAIPFEVRLPR